MNEIKFDSNLFANGMHLRGSTKTSANLSIKGARLCSTCGRYKDKKCEYIGKVKNPDTVIYCSWWKWWKEKFKKEVKIKRCGVCGEIKPIEEFYKSKSSDGHQYKCRDCAIEYGKEYQKNLKMNIQKNLKRI